MSRPNLERVWWCAWLNREVVSDEEAWCDKCPSSHRLADLGWRVGYGPSTWTYHSTHEGALQEQGRRK